MLLQRGSSPPLMKTQKQAIEENFLSLQYRCPKHCVIVAGGAGEGSAHCRSCTQYSERQTDILHLSDQSRRPSRKQGRVEKKRIKIPLPCSSQITYEFILYLTVRSGKSQLESGYSSSFPIQLLFFLAWGEFYYQA